jgi:hypothetical protein
MVGAILKVPENFTMKDSVFTDTNGRVCVAVADRSCVWDTRGVENGIKNIVDFSIKRVDAVGR